MEFGKRSTESKSISCRQTDDITAEIPSRVTSNQTMELERELKPEQNSTTDESPPLYGDRDILNGRGIIRHIANRVFRIFIDLHIHEYFHTPYRDEKSRIIEECLYDLVMAGYRFWNQNQQGGMIEQDLSTCRAKIAHAMRDRSALLKNKTISILNTKHQLKDEGINAIKFAELMANRSTRSNLLYIRDKSPPPANNSPTIKSQHHLTQQCKINLQAQNPTGDKNDDDRSGSQSCTLLNGDVTTMNGVPSNLMGENTYPNQASHQSVIVFNINGKSNSCDNDTSSNMVQSNRTTPLQTPNENVVIVNNNCSNNIMFMIDTSTIYDMPLNPMQPCRIPVQGPNVAVGNNNSSKEKSDVLLFRDVYTTNDVPSNVMQQNTIPFQNQNAVVANSNSGVPMSVLLAHHPYSLIFSRENFLHRSKAPIPYMNLSTSFQQPEIIPFPQGGTMGTLPMPFLNPCQAHQNDPLISKSTEPSHEQTVISKVDTDNAVTDNAASKRNTTDSTNSNETLWSLSAIELCIKMQSTE